MRRLFSAVAERMGLPFIRLGNHEPIKDDHIRSRARVTFLLQDHGFFHSEMVVKPWDTGWHLIRDPRDVLISGANYHGWAKEPWLHQPRDNLRGLTYQQAIRQLTFEDSVRFEMGRSTGKAVRDMLAFDHFGGIITDVSYEALLEDRKGKLLRQALDKLGCDGDELEQCLRVYRSLHISGQRNEQIALRNHIQNIDRAQWTYMYTADLLADFEQAFPDASVRLGYPPSSPTAIVDDVPRRTAYLARFYANRGEVARATELIDTALREFPDNPVLSAARDLVSNETAARGRS